MPPTNQGSQWTESVLYSFQGGGNDGENPSGAVIERNGTLYGVTLGGGALRSNCPQGCGTVFQLTPPAILGAAWTESVIHFFNYGQGGHPSGSPIFDVLGNLYGATLTGGLKSAGVAYRLIPASPGGAWTYKVLYAFLGSDASEPGGLTLHNGMLYGTGLRGGPAAAGSIFQLVPPAVAGGPWTENVLYSFGDGPYPGFYAGANVIFDKAGNLYSTTSGSVGCPDPLPSYCGTVFKSIPNGGVTLLHNFLAPRDGSEGFPPNGVIFGKNGVLYGVTQLGGTGGEGVVFGVVK